MGLFNKYRKSKKCDEELQLNIYKKYYQKVYKTAYYIIKDPYLAQDVLQETFIKAFQQYDRLIDKSKIEAWLATIATRTAIDMIRKQKKWINILEDSVYTINELQENQNSQPVNQIVERNMLFEKISIQILELKPEYREVLVLKIIHEMKDEEIAGFLKISVGTVKSRIHRGKMKLRIALTNDPEFLGGETI